MSTAPSSAARRSRPKNSSASSPPPPGAASSLTLAPGPWALGASPVSNASLGATRVEYVSAALLAGAWRTNRAESIAVTATFASAVSGFTASAVSVAGGGSVYNFTAADGGATYSFGVRPDSLVASSTLTVSVAAGAVTTADGGGNLAASLSVSYDASPPVPAIVSNATKGATAELYIAFSINYGEVTLTSRMGARPIEKLVTRHFWGGSYTAACHPFQPFTALLPPP